MLEPYKKNPRPPRMGVLERAAMRDGTPVLYVDYESLGGQIRTDHLRDVPKDVHIYVPRSVAKYYAKQGMADAIAWNGLIVQLRAEERKIIVLPDEVCELHCLIEWRDWLAFYGAAPTSIVGASLSLIRATLSRRLYLSRGVVPPISTVIGGRIESGVERGWYGESEIWDIQAAYSEGLGILACDGIWKETSFQPASRRTAFVTCEVTLPDTRWGPLPDREQQPIRREERESWIFLQARRSYPTRGEIVGTWSMDEIREALSLGAKVKPLKTYSLFCSSRLPFYGWWEAIQRGRRMNGNAGKLAKMTGNTAWGAFAISGFQSLVRYRDRKRYARLLPFTPPPYRKAYDIAELITAGIRAKVLRELMVPADDKLISVSTDGGLVFPGFVPTGEGWRKKDEGVSLCFVAPYAYAYLTREHRPIYKMAGVPESLRRVAFRALATDARVWKSSFGNPSSVTRSVHRMRQFFPNLERDLTDEQLGAKLVHQLHAESVA